MQHATSQFLEKLSKCTSFILETWAKKYGGEPFPDLEVDYICNKDGVVDDNRDDKMFICKGDDIQKHRFFNEFKKETLTAAFGRFINLEYWNKLRAGNYKTTDPEFKPFCVKVNGQVDSAILQAVQFKKLATDGIHELTVGDEQAIGMTAMRFNIKSEDFLMPVNSMLIHLPRSIFNHEIFKSAVDDFFEEIRTSNQMKMATQESLSDWLAYEKQFRKSGDSVAVLVQAFNGSNKNILARFNIGGSMEFKIICDKNQTFEADLNMDGLPEMCRLIFRAALSAVLISSMKPEVVESRNVDRSVEKTRRHLISKMESITKTTILKPTYSIFQKSMKTYHNRTIPTGVEHPSPSTTTIKPVFVWGHWRNQPHGPKRSLRRLQWIKSYIRNKDLLLGENPEIITSSRFTQPVDIIAAEVDSSQM